MKRNVNLDETKNAVFSFLSDQEEDLFLSPRSDTNNRQSIISRLSSNDELKLNLSNIKPKNLSKDLSINDLNFNKCFTSNQRCNSRADKYLNSKNKMFNYVLDKSQVRDTFSSNYDFRKTLLDRSRDVFNENEYQDRTKTLNTDIEKHLIGQREQHEDYKKYNLNLEQNLNEGYKFFQDQCYKTKINFEGNKILKNQPEINSSTGIVQTQDNLQKNDKKYSDNNKVDFQLNQKMLDKINDDYNLNEEKPDYNTIQLNNCKQNLIAPNNTGILRKNNSVEKLNGQQGKHMMKSMIDSYKSMPDKDQPEDIDLTNNHLTQTDIQPFVKTLRKKIRTLNLRNNKLGPAGAKFFAQHLLDNPLTNLQQLSFESNGIKDKAGEALLDSLQTCINLTHLNLNSNELSSKTANRLDELISRIPINHLELHYNMFKGKDIVDFINNLNESQLQILDLSWNNLGIDSKYILLLFERLRDNTKLVQLNISHNNISLNPGELETSSTYLNSNHTLTGFHVNGNSMRQDIDGRLLPEKDLTADQVLTKVQSENSILQSQCGPTQNKDLLNFNWIVEKWVPQDIYCRGDVVDVDKEERDKKEKEQLSKLRTTSMSPNFYKNTEKLGIFKLKTIIDAEEFLKENKLYLEFKKVEVCKPVFVMFEFDNQEPWLIDPDEHGRFDTKFMVPPGRWKFFFTTQLAYFAVSDQQKIEKLDKPVIHTIIYDKLEPKRSRFEVKLNKYNVIQIPHAMQTVDQSKCPVQPRSRPRFVFTDTAVIWSFPISLWAREKWVKDETETQCKAFDNDWSHVIDKLPKVLKDNQEEQNNIRDIIRDKQYLFCWTQRYFSSYQNIGELFCITELALPNMFTKLDFFSPHFPKECPSIIFRETITSDKHNFKELAPVNGCVRHQFCNIMLKSAIRKFKLEPKLNIPQSRAVEQMFEHHSDEMCMQNPNNWRWDKQQNEKCDMYLKKVGWILDEVLSRYKSTKKGEKPQFSLDAFKKLVKDLEIEDQVDDLHFGRQYNCSLSIQTNHLKDLSFSFLRKNFEFQEAFARLVDESYLVMSGQGINYPESEFQTLDLGDKMWIATPLFLKNIFVDAVKDAKQIEGIKKQCNESGVISFKK